MEEEDRREIKAMNTSKEQNATKRRNKRCCLVITIVVVLLAVITAVIVGVKFFKAKQAVTVFDGVDLRDFALAIDIVPRLAIHFNLTVDARVLVTNPNRVGFKYHNSSVSLAYRGRNIGDAPILAGKIGPRETVRMNVTVTLIGDRVLSDPEFYSDVISGEVPISTHARVTGKVHVLFNIHVKSDTTCDVLVNVSNITLTKTTCDYHTRI